MLTDSNGEPNDPQGGGISRRRLVALVAALPGAAAFFFGGRPSGRTPLVEASLFPPRSGAAPNFMAGPGRGLKEEEVARISEMLALGDVPLQQFGGCPPFSQFSNGTDCIAPFDCAPSFGCRGGILDDFECSGEAHFNCDTFGCLSSFDMSDCLKHGGSFTCIGNYACEGFSCNVGTFQCPSAFSACQGFGCSGLYVASYRDPSSTPPALVRNLTGVKLATL